MNMNIDNFDGHNSSNDSKMINIDQLIEVIDILSGYGYEDIFRPRINYFAQSNKPFKDIIGSDIESIRSYNYCCDYILGTVHDFVGRFTIDHIKRFMDIINEYQNEVICKMDEKHIDFFCNVMIPVIDNLHSAMTNDKKKQITAILEKYIVPHGTKSKESCSICMNAIKKNKHVIFPCNHEYHYDCIMQWFIQKNICPVCRLQINGKKSV